jgi:uncharacterized phage protein (TIGR02218 family)
MSLDTAKTQLTICTCYAFELPIGINAYFTDWGQDLAFLGQTYTAVPIRRSAIKINTDMQTDRVDISIGIIGITIGEAAYTLWQIVRHGFLRNAKVTVYTVDYTAPENYLLRYMGYVRGDIKPGPGTISFSAVSIIGRLHELPVPAILYGRECPLTIYSARCGLDPGDWDESAAAENGSTNRLLYDGVFAYAHHAAGYWLGAKITFTSGDNTGISGSVIDHKDGSVKLLTPLPAAIGTGDGFTAWPHCRRQGSACHGIFDNYANYLGFEYMPNPEALFA